ncbi:MAG TPA: hypothetical protein VKR06_32890 [Ktedonosporobacter sp.]|nr:hypothetical protein [Ktedonosporobacter sp.]
MPTLSLDQAWERASWYAHRWMVEDYHQCMKTGCRIEERQVQSAERLMALLGLLSPMAVRLLQLRQLSRKPPERLAKEVIAPLVVGVLAARSGQDENAMTLSHGMRVWFTHLVRGSVSLHRRTH